MFPLSGVDAGIGPAEKYFVVILLKSGEFPGNSPDFFLQNRSVFW